MLSLNSFAIPSVNNGFTSLTSRNAKRTHIIFQVAISDGTGITVQTGLQPLGFYALSVALHGEIVCQDWYFVQATNLAGIYIAWLANLPTALPTSGSNVIPYGVVASTIKSATQVFSVKMWETIGDTAIGEQPPGDCHIDTVTGEYVCNKKPLAEKNPNLYLQTASMLQRASDRELNKKKTGHVQINIANVF